MLSRILGVVPTFAISARAATQACRVLFLRLRRRVGHHGRRVVDVIGAQGNSRPPMRGKWERKDASI
jgi:hypothetical protein